MTDSNTFSFTHAASQPLKQSPHKANHDSDDDKPIATARTQPTSTPAQLDLPVFDDKPADSTDTADNDAAANLYNQYRDYVQHLLTTIEQRHAYDTVCNNLQPAFERYFDRLCNAEDLRSHNHCYINITELCTILQLAYDTLLTDLILHSEIILNAIAYTVHSMCQQRNVAIKGNPRTMQPFRLHVHPYNIPTNNILNVYDSDEMSSQNYSAVTPLHRIDKLSHNNAHVEFALLTVHGVVVRISEVQTVIQSVEYRCTLCDNKLRVQFQYGDSDTRQTCDQCSKLMRPDHRTIYPCYFQLMSVRSVQRTSNKYSRVDVQLYNCLCNTVRLGDFVTVVGVAEKRTVTDRRAITAQERQYILANTLYAGVEYVTAVPKQYAIGYKHYTPHDIADALEIKAMLADPAESERVQRIIINSVAPYILGHSQLKLLLLCALYGGCTEQHSGPTRQPKKSVSVLLAADTQEGRNVAGDLLKGISEIAPNSKHIDAAQSDLGKQLLNQYTTENDCEFASAGVFAQCNNGALCIEYLNAADNKTQNQFFNTLNRCTQNMTDHHTERVSHVSCNVFATIQPKAKGKSESPSKRLVEECKVSQDCMKLFDVTIVVLEDNRDADLSDRYELRRHMISTGKIVTQDRLAAKRGSEDAGSAEAQEFLYSLTMSVDEQQETLFKPDEFRNLIAYCRDTVQPHCTPETRSHFDARFRELVKVQAADTVNERSLRMYYTLYNLCVGYARFMFSDTISEETIDKVFELFHHLCPSSETVQLVYGQVKKCAPSRQPAELLKMLSERTKQNEVEWDDKVCTTARLRTSVPVLTRTGGRYSNWWKCYCAWAVTHRVQLGASLTGCMRATSYSSATAGTNLYNAWLLSIQNCSSRTKCVDCTLVTL